MACLGSVAYDPGTAAEKATTALAAMAAFDTTNARITFEAPTSGKVLVRIKCQTHGATTSPRILLGVLEGSTVIGRMAPIGSRMNVAATSLMAQEVCFVVTGLTGGNEYTWDAAYGIEVAVASTGIKYGGPNNTTTNDARGALIFEVWDATELLAGKLYDPGTRVEKATTSNLAQTAFDTTNLRLSFTAPSSGRVMWRVAVPSHGATTAPQVLLGILESTTVKARSAPVAGHPSTAVATANAMLEATGVISGLEAGKEYTWDAAYGVEVTVTSTSLKYGGPNNTTENDAQGGIAFEIWKA